MRSGVTGVKGEVWGVERLDGVYSNTHTPICLSTHTFTGSEGLQGMECGQCPGGLGPFLLPPRSSPSPVGVE